VCVELEFCCCSYSDGSCGVDSWVVCGIVSWHVEICSIRQSSVSVEMEVSESSQIAQRRLIYLHVKHDDHLCVKL
jgi:hypothetical protein